MKCKISRAFFSSVVKIVQYDEYPMKVDYRIVANAQKLLPETVQIRYHIGARDEDVYQRKS